jgi:DNA transformation protein and related proteins
MSIDEGLMEWISEALEPLGRVTKRAMMGGATLYLDGTVFAVYADDALWFKADTQSDHIWDAEECPRFTYAFKNGKIGSMNYRRAPDDVHDDGDAMRHWAEMAVEAGRRGAVKKAKGNENISGTQY